MNNTPARRKPWNARDVDPFMLALVLADALVALAIGQHTDQLALALQGAGALTALALAAAWGLRGKPSGRTLTTLVLGGLVVLQVHLSRGALEWHFNVFVTMGLVLAWRDWRPVALLTGFFALHHLGFDRLLAAGVGTYCLSQPDLGRIALHVVFVAVMGVALARVAFSQGREVEEARELEFLVNAMGREGPIRLQLDVVRVSTPAALRLRQVQQRMAEALGLVRDAAQCVRLASEHAASGSAELMDRTQATAAGLKDAAMSLEQISVIVQNSNEAALQAKGLSGQATTMADEGGRMVADVVQSMRAIEQSSRRIGDIVGVIDGIAFQTNILALNAAVEAARAGEQGRGFAVVAAEVRSLAQRSAAAAKEIKGLVADSEATVSRGAGLVSGTGDRMQGLVQTVRHVGGLFDEITADASDHAQGLNMVTQSMETLGTMTEQNTALAGRTGAAAQLLQDQVTQLDAVLGAFRIGPSGGPAAGADALQRLLNAPVAPRQPLDGSAGDAAAGARGGGGSGVEFF